MRVLYVRGGRTPTIKPAKQRTSMRSRALAWYFRPRIGWSVAAMCVFYVLQIGWPSVLVNYEYREAYGAKHVTSCTYWNPGDGVSHRYWDRCAFLLGGGDAYKG